MPRAAVGSDTKDTNVVLSDSDLLSSPRNAIIESGGGCNNIALSRGLELPMTPRWHGAVALLTCYARARCISSTPLFSVDEICTLVNDQSHECQLLMFR